MANPLGLEPRLTVLETAVLPLNTRDLYMVACTGNDPVSIDYQSIALPLS